MASYLLDTDYLIEALAGKPKAVNTIEKLAPHGIAVSMITLGEIYHGAYATTNPQAHIESYHQFIAPFRILNLSEEVMQKFGETRELLERRGKIIPDFDILIGATAICNGLTLLTFNLKDFKRIPDLRLYPPAA